MLTATQKKVLNNISAARDATVLLGNIVDGILATPDSTFSIENGTPVNAVSAKETLTLSGVVIHGETIDIGDDTYQFAADDLQSITRPEMIPVDITASTTKATGTLTMDTQPIAGDKVTIGEKVYTFVPVGTDTADGEVSIGADLAGAQAALVAAINGTDGISTPHPLVSAAAFAANACAITALIGGVAGNLIATTETFTAVTNVFGDVTLKTGADCTAANAITALVAAITANAESVVTAVDGAGDTVVITSIAGGVAGNEIAIAEGMANGSFTGGATHLSGGVDGTVATDTTMLIDATYLYICIGGNAITEKNWRRIALGAAF